jgi:cytochrome P450
VARDTTIDGVPLPAGAGLLIALAAANRDPVRFPDPDRFDVLRPGNHPLSFGGGAHHCLGASLARMEAEAVVRRLVTEHAGTTVGAEPPAYRSGFPFRGPLTLPVVLG